MSLQSLTHNLCPSSCCPVRGTRYHTGLVAASQICSSRQEIHPRSRMRLHYSGSQPHVLLAWKAKFQGLSKSFFRPRPGFCYEGTCAERQSRSHKEMCSSPVSPGWSQISLEKLPVRELVSSGRQCLSFLQTEYRFSQITDTNY